MEENDITHLEGLEDHLVLTQNPELGQAFGDSLGKTDETNELSDAKKRSLKSNMGRHEKRMPDPLAGETVRNPFGG
jgi:hypothetical protein